MGFYLAISLLNFCNNSNLDLDLEEDELGTGTYKPYFMMYGEARRLSKKSTVSEFSTSFVGRRPSKKSCHSDILPVSNKQNSHVLWAEVVSKSRQKKSVENCN